MSDDIMCELNKSVGPQSTLLSDYNIQQRVLFELEHLLNSVSTTRSLAEFGILLPDAATVVLMANRLVQEEQDFNMTDLAAEHEQLCASLNCDQRNIYEEVMTSFSTFNQILMFVYGYGGTGKTFLWRTVTPSIFH